MEHSPLPWRAEPSPRFNSWLVLDAGGNAVLLIPGAGAATSPRVEGDARLIAHAASAHAQLVAACEQAVRRAEAARKHVTAADAHAELALLVAETRACLTRLRGPRP